MPSCMFVCLSISSIEFRKVLSPRQRLGLTLNPLDWGGSAWPGTQAGHLMHSSQKKTDKIVRMDQKWTKRQNERSPASRKTDLAPFYIHATKWQSQNFFSAMEVVFAFVFTLDYLTRIFIANNRLSYIRSPMGVLDLVSMSSSVLHVAAFLFIGLASWFF